MIPKIILILLLIIFISVIAKSQPLQNHLLIATSTDGLNFKKLNKVLFDFGDVPDAVVSSSGNVYVYFQGIVEPLHDIIVVGISSNGIDNWSFQAIKIFGIENWKVRPCDPDIIYKDGIFRLYFTGDPTNDRIPETYSATSSDGINFSLENGFRFSGDTFPVLNPSLLWIADTLHYFAGGKSPTMNWHAVSTDGLQFKKLNDFFAYGLMMSNGIHVDSVYRFYGFSNSPPQNIRSISTLDGKVWTSDPGIRLELDPTNILESNYVKDPAIVFKDSLYIMYYVTRKKEFTDVETTQKNFQKEFYLEQNYPNPFSSTTTIRFQSKTRYGEISDLRLGTIITLKVYDLLGREIATIFNDDVDTDEHSIQYNATKYQLKSGMYIYELKAGENVARKYMIVFSR